VILAAFLFPLPFTAIALNGGLGNAGVYDKLFQAIVGYGQILMLPMVLGIIATLLFFMERDHNTLKNLRTIPIGPIQMVTAKLFVLFALGFVFSAASTGSSILGGMLVGGINDVFHKFVIGSLTGVLLTAGTLPVIIAIVFLNRSYIISIILSLFYSVINFAMIIIGLPSHTSAMQLLTSILPSPIIYRWHMNLFISPSDAYYTNFAAKMLPLHLVVFNIAILAVLSYIAIVLIYRKREV
jgi:bacitracin transport system permease protein